MGNGRFKMGDRIRVYDKDGYVVAEGEALHSRDFFGLAEFQVWVQHGRDNEGWARTFNLNFVRVEVMV